MSVITAKKTDLERLAVSDFGDKSDLVRACLASIHVPFFLNGKLYSQFRGQSCIDGHWRCKREFYEFDGEYQPVFMDWREDEAVAESQGVFQVHCLLVQLTIRMSNR